LKVLLIGESCEDVYFFGECTRLSPEAPVPVLDYFCKKKFLGMSENVLRNLKSFNFNLDFISNNPSLLVKERYIDKKSKKQLLRVDKGFNVKPLSLNANVLKKIKTADLIVISDYNKGFLTQEICKKINKKRKGFMFVDSKKPDLSCFENCFIKINNLEFSVKPKLPKRCDMIITQGSKGALYKNKKYKAPKVNVHDVSGAGDVFLSVLSGVFIKTKNIKKSIKAAVELSSKSVSYFGNYQISKKDISQYIS